jgi:hypothetical protein
VDLTLLSESIKLLGDKATVAADIQTKELQQNCVKKIKYCRRLTGHRHKTLEREKINQHKTVQRENSLKHEALEKRDCAYSQQQKLGDCIAKHKAEKLKLQQELLLHDQNKPFPKKKKKKKEMTDLFEEQIKQVEEEIAQDERHVLSLMDTLCNESIGHLNLLQVTSCSITYTLERPSI